MIDNDFESRFKKILNYLKQTRKRQKISQHEIANYLKINQTVYSKIEVGQQKMTAIQLLQIMSILSVDYSILESFLLLPPKNDFLDATTPDMILQRENDMLQKHIADLQTLIEQQQKIISRLTEKG